METAHATSPDSNGSRAVAGEGSGDLRSSSVRVSARRRHGEGDLLAGRYRILGLLGEGGMGAVWRAHCLSLDVDVAIKVLHHDHPDVNAAARQLREARATASLGHPAIVRTLDFGETEEGEPFLVMDLLDGSSLATWLEQRGRMPAAQAVRVLLPIADALSAAHDQGIVHRDIKPDNIILVADGPGTYRPTIFDFGIAKVAPLGSAHVLTEAGAILGSLQYMSPEQADGKVVGEQTDVWGLCVVLYELIAGRRPFDASTLTATILALHSCAPAPTTDFAAGDEGLWRIIERGLKKSPADRWPTMSALGCALASWAVERGIDTDAAGSSIAHHWLGAASEPAPAPCTGGPAISVAPTRVGPPSSPSSPGVDPVSSIPEPDAAHPAVTSYFALVSRVAPRRPRRRAGLALGAGVALLVTLIGVAAAFGTQRGGAVPGARPVAAAAIDPGGVAAAPPAGPSIRVAPRAVEAPAVVRVEPVASAAVSAHPVTPGVRSKRASTSMPLPASPNF